LNNPDTKTVLEAESSKPKVRVLLVEDDPTDCELIFRQLSKSEFQIIGEVARTPDEFQLSIRTHPPDVVLADYNLGQWRGTETVELLRAEGLDIPVILVSGALGEVAAVECIKQGATDYVLKDSLARLSVALRRALDERVLRRERTLAQKALAERVEELEQVTYVASHDLQEPLRMVASYTQLLAERYRGKLDDNADAYIEYAVEGAMRMQSLIQDLLKFSLVARREAILKSTDCNAIVEQATGKLQGAILECGAVITCDPLPWVMANGSQLQQVFQNLIENALKFNGSQPPVIHISGTRQGTEWIFSVADNGIGISAEYADIVFIIFKRLHGRAEYAGNGVGLAICKKIVEWHGGKIKFISHAGGGTNFQFTLPVGKLAEKCGDRRDVP
jgi:signal transduction histidine kinase